MFTVLQGFRLRYKIFHRVLARPVRDLGRRHSFIVALVYCSLVPEMEKVYKKDKRKVWESLGCISKRLSGIECASITSGRIRSHFCVECGLCVLTPFKDPLWLWQRRTILPSDYPHDPVLLWLASRSNLACISHPHDSPTGLNFPSHLGILRRRYCKLEIALEMYRL